MRRFQKADPSAPMGRFRAVNRWGVYRDHPKGEVFEERLSRRTQLAIERGDIEFIEEVVPCLQAGTYALPPGWLSEPTSRPTNRRQAVLS